MQDEEDRYKVMLDMTEVINTISDLEKGDTTFENCIKLAALYTIRNNNLAEDKVEEELSEILPAYTKYVAVKKEYQLGKVTDKAIISSINIVCNEIDDFIHTLYNSTDTEDERELIEDMINSIHSSIKDRS